jgi:hypothetical protein
MLTSNWNTLYMYQSKTTETDDSLPLWYSEDIFRLILDSANKIRDEYQLHLLEYDPQLSFMPVRRALTESHSATTILKCVIPRPLARGNSRRVRSNRKFRIQSNSEPPFKRFPSELVSASSRRGTAISNEAFRNSTADSLAQEPSVILVMLQPKQEVPRRIRFLKVARRFHFGFLCTVKQVEPIRPFQSRSNLVPRMDISSEFRRIRAHFSIVPNGCILLLHSLKSSDRSEICCKFLVPFDGLLQNQIQHMAHRWPHD